MSQALTRRMLLKTAAVGAAAAFSRRTAAQTSPRVVIVGGGFGGATCARELKRKGLAVTLVEASAVYTACPFSNAVLAGLRPIETQQFKLDAVKKGGIDIVRQRARPRRSTNPTRRSRGWLVAGLRPARPLSRN